MAIRITEKQFANLPAFVMKQAIKATKRAMMASAQKAFAEARNTAEIIKWSGEYRRAFVIEPGKGDNVVVRVYNNAPHAEAIEVGQAPYVVSSVEFYRIIKWAQTKLGQDYNRARMTAITVAARIAQDGKYALGVRNGRAHYVLKIAVDKTAGQIPKTWKTHVKKWLESNKVPG